MEELKRIQKYFPDFCQCRRRHEVNKEKYDKLSKKKKEKVAERVAKQLQERVEKDKFCQEMLGTYIPALVEIDITPDDTLVLPSQQ